jgi:localization factor PodJL
MSSGTPWSVKGIDPRARAVAKTAARKEGMTLGEWLNRVILDDGETEDSLGRRAEGYPGFSRHSDDNAAQTPWSSASPTAGSGRTALDPGAVRR